MLRIAICDDEKYMSDKIKIMVSDYFCGKTWILQYHNSQAEKNY